MRRVMFFVATGLMLTAAACGRTPGDRAVSGGLIGAGGGAALGAATGGSPLAGALIGGAGGAIIGAVTTPDGGRRGHRARRHRRDRY